jgi:hypothetical protein
MIKLYLIIKEIDMEFGIKRGGLRILSEHSPALRRTRLMEVAPLIAALGRGALEVGKHVGAGAVNAAGGVGAGLASAGVGLAKGVGTGIKNAASGLVQPAIKPKFELKRSGATPDSQPDL